MLNFVLITFLWVASNSLPYSAAEYFKLKELPLENMPQFPIDSCTSKLVEIFADTTFLKLLAYSGKGINDLGSYNGCKNEKGFYYLFVTMALPVLPVSLGICLPRECSFGLIQSKKPFIVELISKITNIEIKPSDIILTDPATINKDLTRWTLGPILVIAGIGLLVIWELLVTFLDYNECLEYEEGSNYKRILACYSLYRNAESIAKIGNKLDPQLEVLNGIRLLSMFWVVLAHSFTLEAFSPVRNLKDVAEDVFNSYFVGIIKAGTLAVDVFFFLSGFLAALSLVQVFKNPRYRNISSILGIYIKRYVRLTPLIVILLLYTIYLQPLFFDSPRSSLSKQFADKCSADWYTVLSYVSNFTTKFLDICDAWLWYIFVDMQFYILTPLIILPYCIKKTVGYIVFTIMFIGCLLAQTLVFCHYKLNLSLVKLSSNPDMVSHAYIMPYSRALPYFIGILLYLFYAEGNDSSNGSKFFLVTRVKAHNSRILRYFMYILGISIVFAIIYSFYYLDKYPKNWSESFGIVHMITSRPMFVIGISLLIYPVLIGHGNLLLFLLGRPIFGIMGKLTYGVYLFHMLIYMAIALHQLQADYYSIFDRILAAIMVFSLSYIISFFLTIVVESPIVQLLKISSKKKEVKKESKLLSD